MLTIELTENSEGNTELTLTQTNIPEGQTQYEKGWGDNYFNPMTAFISNL